MATIKLVHNDDEVLDPADLTLQTRGSLQIDKHERGSWESHRDGTWTARLGHALLSAASEQELIALIEGALHKTAG